MGQPGLFFSLFSVFSNKHHYNFLTTNKCEKCPSSIQCWDLNPRPSEHEPLPITTRPGLLPLAKLIVAKGFKKLPKMRKIAKSGHTVGDQGQDFLPKKSFRQYLILNFVPRFMIQVFEVVIIPVLPLVLESSLPWLYLIMSSTAVEGNSLKTSLSGSRTSRKQLVLTV